ncbi:heavy metal translocating P-type ATPase [Dongia deserti]|uniref:heavy metal translocating P-type ATPase n=1 Tax=Dongia deserti TaxID=2268030 RepID=UPI000E6524C6|nr:heavy metal translocating P-type ATPase [Dongia deserti]
MTSLEAAAPAQTSVQSPRAADRHVTIGVTGMTCAACVGRIERVLKRVPGVAAATVNLATEIAWIEGDARVTPAAIEAAIAKAGYGTRPVDHGGVPEDQGKLRRELAWILAGVALTTPLIVPMLGALLDRHVMLSAWWQLALAAPVQFWLGAPFYRGAWKALRGGTANMDVLVALGTSAAFGLSLHLMTTGTVHLYFETAAVIIVLVRLGKWLEARAKRRTLKALEALESLRPTEALVRRDGQDVVVAVNALRLNELLVVKPGGRIAADGVVAEGRSAVDQSLLTGESKPVDVELDDHVIGGAVNGDGLLLVRVTAIGAESMLSRIVRMVAEAQGAKAPIQRLVDKISAVFVPVVLVIAAMTVAGWVIAGHGWEPAILHAVAVLVIACPCALGLATPTAIMVGTGVGAKNGILIRDAVALETAGATTIMAFDKTGTLTVGKPHLTDIVTTEGLPRDRLLALAAGLQQGANHPLAHAVTEAAAHVTPLTMSDLRTLPGRGVAGCADGRSLLLGNGRLMQEQGIDLAALSAAATRLQAQGYSVSYLADVDAKRALAALAFGDAPKASVKQALAALHKLGVRTLMLTGDNVAAARHLAAEIGIDDVRAELLPADKVGAVTELKSKGETVAMVGDGVNDAPALAAADLGIAMATGTDVAIETAGVALMRGDPLLAPAAIDLARATRRKIVQNLVWAFLFNVLGIPLAAMGGLTPIVAGAAMALSSVTVVTNALSLNRWRFRVSGGA